MMVINNNIPALTTYGIVNNTSNALQKSIQKLSTGLRINSAADDAAGLSISEKMRAQINGLDRAVANAQDGISLIQTAEGALTETHSILQRMRELSVQAANDTFTAQDRSYIQEEVDLLREEIDHIGNTTTFNTKKLLNGDSAVLWSSSDLSTKAIVNGGLRNIDQFGQKKSVEGNYKITVEATAGQAEVQKTDIFKVKHDNVGQVTIDTDSTTGYGEGVIDSIDTSKLDGGKTYTVAGGGHTAAAVDPTVISQKVSDTTNSLFKDASFLAWTDGAAAAANENAGRTYDLVFEVLNVAATSATSSKATIKMTGYETTESGTVREINETFDITGTGTATTAKQNIPNGITVSGTYLQLAAGISNTNVSALKKGDKILINAANQPTADATSRTEQFSVAVGDPATAVAHKFNVGNSDLADKEVTFSFMDLDSTTGQVTRNSMTMKLGDNANVTNTTNNTFETAKAIATISPYKIGDVAKKDVKLRDLDKFWDSQGNFMLEDPQTIKITQGDGKTATVTLYGHDTLGEVEEKLNKAIAEDLGQKAYVDDADQFVNYVDSSTEDTPESVAGTFVIRSVVAGKDGTLRFSSKNEDLINAFSLNTIQSSKESTYNVTITDAHSGESVVETQKITGNVLIGKLHENVDVEFDAMTGITATWNDGSKTFDYNTSTSEETILHLADNTMVFQIGANEGDDMGINIGDMRSHALGLDKVLVTDHDSASRSIGIIDNAIDKVSTQRAKLGAYQNRLEHTMTNLQTSSENLSAAESRIRDTDMAKEMMNFTKLQIMLQAGNSMLAQANQLPQNVLSLIR